ncbi:carbohydrate ABC transporter permease [Paenibacillus gansuensis]|uniref:Carbohydrate ABC transporter permease n=1 Tax=Paenibacillus gansuensis TaxID=306542 RepID=A0ABW5PE44_9BACL
MRRAAAGYVPGRIRRRNGIAYLMILPAMLLFLSLVIIPAVQSLYTSLTDWNGIKPAVFIGLQNYIDIFTSPDSKFYTAFQNNLFWLVFGSTLPVALGLVQANLLVRNRLKYSNVFQMIFFLPQILSVTVACVIWSWIYDPISGPINDVLRRVGLDSWQRSWLGDSDIVMFSLLVVYVWLAYGFSTVVFSAAIQGVDTQLYEAATMDGCSKWRQFWNVTLPSIRRPLHTVILLQIIASFQVFDIIYIMTKGGPGYDSYVLSYYVFSEGFLTSRVGYGSALSIVLAALLFLVSFVYTKLTERMERE